MEKEGFVWSINFINNKGIKIEQIITDRHVQIVKHIREEMPNTKHYFDVWHVAKGLKKKLVRERKNVKFYSLGSEVCITFSIEYLLQHQVEIVKWCWRNGSQLLIMFKTSMHMMDSCIPSVCMAPWRDGNVTRNGSNLEVRLQNVSARL